MIELRREKVAAYLLKTWFIWQLEHHVNRFDLELFASSDAAHLRNSDRFMIVRKEIFRDNDAPISLCDFSKLKETI